MALLAGRSSMKPFCILSTYNDGQLLIGLARAQEALPFWSWPWHQNIPPESGVHCQLETSSEILEIKLKCLHFWTNWVADGSRPSPLKQSVQRNTHNMSMQPCKSTRAIQLREISNLCIFYIAIMINQFQFQSTFKNFHGKPQLKHSHRRVL